MGRGRRQYIPRFLQTFPSLILHNARTIALESILALAEEAARRVRTMGLLMASARPCAFINVCKSVKSSQSMPTSAFRVRITLIAGGTFATLLGLSATVVVRQLQCILAALALGIASGIP